MRWVARLVTALALPAIVVLGWNGASALDTDLARPLSLRGADYVGSQACRRCHHEQHASWWRTFHRTMTQEATDASVLGDFSDVSLDYLGVRARMHRDASGAHLVSFARAGGAERWQARVDRTVGSHRYQQYLARVDDEWLRLPVAWDVADQRWMHMNGAFLTPDPDEPPAGGAVPRPEYDRHVTRWNDNCVYCHNVAPRPGLDATSGRFDTEVAELGIACEACHGPGSDHVRRNTNPLRRYALHFGVRGDPSIANPQRLTPQRSADVCGRCHGQRIAPDIARVHREGDLFLPGEALARYSRPLARDTTLRGEPGVFAARFWPDGTPRLTAYEYQGLLQSACHARGELTCESCHAMHDSEPAGQLRRDLDSDAMCTQCHAELADTEHARQHTKHDPAGTGARCRGCHMPNVVYGLVDARISHRIETPDPLSAASHGRPDACTLCHTDRSRGWAIEHAGGSANAEGVEVDGVPEVTRMLLAGDPIERAVAAHALGSPASPAELAPRIGLLLDTLVEDDYPGVRGTAWRALRRALDAKRIGGRITPQMYAPTGARAQREAEAHTLRAQLPPALQERPDEGLVARLRPLAREVAIEIGE